MSSILEGLIPSDERRRLGQYFTRADIVDLILKFCLRDKDDFVLDPSCGAGIFLKRAYCHKRVMNARLSHKEILATLWGVDIAKSAVRLATINLDINDLGGEENYPRIIHGDFFDQRPAAIGFALPEPRTVPLMDDGQQSRKVEHPPHFDCVVGNPPYTRQEWMEHLIGDEGSKRRLIEQATSDQNGQRFACISKRAGIYVYFFTHGTGFLRDGGRFGFVVPNSWLDVGYGKGLQEFFLKHYKIVVIIESKIERWFPDADVNTCIVVLEKCGDADTRAGNLVRFVQLRRKLAELIPAVSGGLQEEAERLHQIDLLIEHVMTKHRCYRDDDLRVNPLPQRELWVEGCNAETDRYEGAKWGKYLRAPDVYLDILERNRDKLVLLSEIADVRRGFTTGANKFFYLDEKDVARWEIEPEYLKPVIKSPRECRPILVRPEDVRFKVLLVHQDKEQLAGTNVLKYIEFGESQGYHQRRTCASRARWYDLGKREPGSILWGMIHYQRHLSPFNSHSFQVDHNLFEIFPKGEQFSAKTLCALLNSTLANLVRELIGRTTLGQGALKTEGIDIAQVWLPDPRKLTLQQVKALGTAFDALAGQPVESIFEEVKKTDRRVLDAAVFDILDLSPGEREAVYQAVVDMVRARIERARSVTGPLG